MFGRAGVGLKDFGRGAWGLDVLSLSPISDQSKTLSLGSQALPFCAFFGV